MHSKDGEENIAGLEGQPGEQHTEANSRMESARVHWDRNGVGVEQVQSWSQRAGVDMVLCM